MGICKYCSESAGLFRSFHKECEVRFLYGVSAIKRAISSAAQTGEGFNKLQGQVEDIAKYSKLSRASAYQAISEAWEEAALLAVGDNLFTAEEEQRILAIGLAFGLDPQRVLSESARTKMYLGASLRELLNGRQPPCPYFNNTSIPFNLLKSETVVWLFHNVSYIEEKTRRERITDSSGVSTRVARGLYVRGGTSHSYTYETTAMEHQDTGMLLMTSANLYFGGSRKSFRIPYKKIVSVQAYSDGIGIMRDLASAKPQVFITGNGWFTHNMIINLSAGNLLTGANIEGRSL